ncbi:nuclear transport factor 2 family protein [Aquimarina aquimarini]|uniref:nuclear transport factor 2 family protein n=1 Tax=Aquimarina aquimarini TaxID=1191734 RepID=UPI000D551AB2|nr:nuclear transport factor 2 family protein [Aquimarina aquimarini]
MKKTFLVLALFGSIAFTFAQKSDYSQIEKTVWYYLDGDTQKDYELLKKAFHKNATMKYVSSKKGYTESNALEAFKSIQGKEPETNRMNRIEYINIAGKSANAKIEVVYPNAVVVDYMNLLKIEGEWKIVSKIYSMKRKKK